MIFLVGVGPNHDQLIRGHDEGDCEARHMVIESIASPCNDVSIGFYVSAGGLNSISRQKKL